MTNPETFSKEWFDKHFHPDTPDDLRRAAEHIVRAYSIVGICDPGYIANVIAAYTGRGDGQSNFHPVKPPNIEIHLSQGAECIKCDSCHRFITDDDAIIHTSTAKEFGGEGLFITHTGCVNRTRHTPKRG